MGSSSLRSSFPFRLLVAACLAFVATTAVASAATPARPLATAVIESDEIWSDADAPLMAQRIRASGATFVRTALSWYGTAPYERPAGFNPEDPNHPSYNWSAFDRKLRIYARYGLQPIVAVYDGPPWARYFRSYLTNSVVDPVEYGRFMKAAATRYSGSTPGLPRVRYWQIWVEPNLHTFYAPQFNEGTGEPYAPRIYREMVNNAADAIHSVHADNIVIAGNTAPFRDVEPMTRRFNERWGPLTFMREFLCLGRDLRPSCNEGVPVRFDAYGHDPYTNGGPTHQANLPDDVSIGDLPEMRAVLDAAVRAGHVRSNGPVRFFAMEFGWDTNPPDPQALPLGLHTRWTAEALYRMWTHGVTIVTWLQLRDAPFPRFFVQSGLWWNGRDSRGANPIQRDRPKPALQAFRFPLVGFVERGRVMVWGRTPAGRRARVLVEQSFRGGWKRLGILPTNGFGIFQQRFRTATTGFVRARTLDRGERAVPFSLRNVPDCFVQAFGTVPGVIESDPSNPRYCISRR